MSARDLAAASGVVRPTTDELRVHREAINEIVAAVNDAELTVWFDHLHDESARCVSRSSTCATVRLMESVGLRELRQDASDLVRRVESGEHIDITVAGRLAARMVPVTPKRWQTWDAIAHVFTGPPDANWRRDHDLIEQSISNPWHEA